MDNIITSTAPGKINIFIMSFPKKVSSYLNYSYRIACRILVKKNVKNKS